MPTTRAKPKVNCPRRQCLHPETTVRFVRQRHGRTERNRQCAKCGYRFWTAQHPEAFLRPSKQAPV